MAVNESRPSDGFWAQVNKIDASRRVDRRHISLLGDATATSLLAHDIPKLAILFDNAQRKLLHPDASFDAPMSQPTKERLTGSHMVLISGTGIILAMQDVPQDVRTDPFLEGLSLQSEKSPGTQMEERSVFAEVVYQILTTEKMDTFHRLPHLVAEAIVTADSEALSSMHDELVWLECATRKPQIRRFTTGVLDVARPALDKMHVFSGNT